MSDGVVRMVVLVERDSPQSVVAVSRGWVIPKEVFADMEATFRRYYGPPAQEGMRDLATRDDVVMDRERRDTDG
jgi:hypothetical protein